MQAQNKDTSKNRSERLKVGLRSAAVRLYGEHRKPEIESRSRFLGVSMRELYDHH
jgi:hypothetical protein